MKASEREGVQQALHLWVYPLRSQESKTITSRWLNLLRVCSSGQHLGGEAQTTRRVSAARPPCAATRHCAKEQKGPHVSKGAGGEHVLGGCRLGSEKASRTRMHN